MGDDILGYTGFRAPKSSQLRDCKCVCSLPSKPRRAHARSAVAQHTFTYACPRLPEVRLFYVETQWALHICRFTLQSRCGNAIHSDSWQPILRSRECLAAVLHFSLALAP